MARGIDKQSEKKLIAGAVAPSFKPRKIAGGKMHGTAGAPIVRPVVSEDTDVLTLEQEFKDLKKKFDAVGKLLDQSGETMKLCQNLPPVIQERYARQKRDDESCWGFYKRMVGIAMESPTIDPLNGVTTAEQIADSGNDVVTDPFGNDVFGVTEDTDEENLPDTNPSFPTRSNGYNENPGKSTLLMMLFLAILKLIISSVFGVLKYPFKLLQKQSKTHESAIGAAPGGGSAILSAASVVLNIIKQLLFSKSVSLALNWVQKKVAGGPKLNRDVERFDALILTGFVKETAYVSEEDYWPEAAQLFPHYEGLNKQYNASMGIFDYYRQQGFHQGQTADTALKTTGEQVLKVPSDMVSILTLQKDYYSSSLDRMNRILGGHFTDNLFCCLFRFLGANDDRFLRTCQAILRMSMNRQALAFESLDSSLGNLWQTIQKVLLSQILSIVSNLFDEINRNVKGRLNLSVSSDVYKLGTCLSWNAFVDNMLKYIRDIELSILDLAIDLNNSLQLQEKYQVIYVDGLEKNQSAKRLLKLIDIIIRARKNGELCRNSNVPTDSELSSLYNQVRDQYNLPDTPTDIGTTSGGTTGTVTVTNVAGHDNFNDCLKKIPKEDVEKVMAWINNLKGQS